MIILFFGPEGHMSYSLAPRLFFHSRLKVSTSWLGFSFRTLTLERCRSPDPHFSLNSCVLFLILLPYRTFGNPACWAGLNSKEYNQSDLDIDHLVMSMCRVISCIVGRGCLLWPVCSLGKTLLAFALLHFVLQSQTCLLLQVSLDFLLLHSSPL